jgi:chemotaxis protein MotB
MILLSSCVTAKKYKDLEARQREFEFSSQTEIKMLQDEKEQLERKLKNLDAVKNQLMADIDDCKSKYDALKSDREATLAKYDALLEQNKNVLSVASSEKEELTNQLSRQQRDLQAKETLLKSLEFDLKAKEKDLNLLTNNLKEREAKIKELQQLVDAQNRKVADLKAKLNNALKGFSTSDLTVKEQNGKIYVSMSQNLLFATGSDKIDPKGVGALKQLANVLALNTDIDILVEGHTDNTGTADLNWDLSTNRALAVVKVLTANKVEGKRITAAGRGMFSPIADNKDAIGKAQNRRTEIILSPKLDELYQLLSE